MDGDLSENGVTLKTGWVSEIGWDTDDKFSFTDRVWVYFRNDAGGFKANRIYNLSALEAYSLFNEQHRKEVIKAAKLIADAGLLAIGVGEVSAAYRAYKASRGIYALYLMIKAGTDAGVGLTDVVIQNSLADTWSKTAEGQAKLDRWNTICTAYTIGSISASAVETAVKKFGIKAISTEDEFSKVCDELEGVTKTGKNWITAIGKNIDELTEAPEGYQFFTYNGKKFIKRLDASNVNTPRLTVKEGKIVKYCGQTISSLSENQINDLVKSATQNPTAEKGVMLGKYTKDATSYTQRAKEDYIYYNLENWNDIFELVNENPKEMWKINKAFIDKLKFANMDFYFSHDPRLETNSFLKDEYDYLTNVLHGKKDLKYIKEDNLWRMEW